MAFGLETGPENVVSIKVVGVGGGGNNVVNRMVRSGAQGVDFVAVNTDKQALNASSATYKIQIGEKLTGGKGAGSNPEVGRKAAEESRNQLAKALENTDMVFVTAGMGGGTGTGASPVVARIARERGMLTVGIVTIPFLFEGEKKIIKALEGADEMSKYVDAMLIINNERLTEIYSDLEFDNAFDKADETLTDAARSISELINFKGKINLDFEDVNTTLKDGGTAIISTGYGEGENRVTKAIEDALNSPLLKNRDVQTSKRFLFNLYYSKKSEHPFMMGEANEITAFMNNFAKDVDVIWGTSVDDTLGDKVKITILASGFEISLSNETTYRPKPRIFGRPKQEPVAAVDDSRISEEYGKEKVEERKRQKVSANYILLTPQQMDNDTLINFIEKTPTFRRGSDIRLREDWRTLAESQAKIAEPTHIAPKPAQETGHGMREIEFD